MCIFNLGLVFYNAPTRNLVVPGDVVYSFYTVGTFGTPAGLHPPCCAWLLLGSGTLLFIPFSHRLLPLLFVLETPLEQTNDTLPWLVLVYYTTITTTTQPLPPQLNVSRLHPPPLRTRALHYPTAHPYLDMLTGMMQRSLYCAFFVSFKRACHLMDYHRYALRANTVPDGTNVSMRFPYLLPGRCAPYAAPDDFPRYLHSAARFPLPAAAICRLLRAPCACLAACTGRFCTLLCRLWFVTRIASVASALRYLTYTFLPPRCALLLLPLRVCCCPFRLYRLPPPFDLARNFYTVMRSAVSSRCRLPPPLPAFDGYLTLPCRSCGSVRRFLPLPFHIL